MRNREERRYLTERYQQKQVRLANQLRRFRPYDSQRYLQRPLAIRQRFFDELKGRCVGPQWNSCERKWKTLYMLNEGYDIDPFTRSELGRYRNHSYSDCGRSGCPCCGNPRRNEWSKKKDRITLQERTVEESFREQVDYYYQYEEARCIT